ncbi:lytic polysaccharide monooxygenase [Facilibium subflavum]|uniref:lytic polysaccharide monooxygenase n=1 Tax=Facilibium subflavum TaxID=2219058 RepID=UPI000E6551FB|nr:lytic polysaccharide monooxygenase [Facilibium subflavum]
MSTRQIKPIYFVISSLGFYSLAFSHGYIDNPASRAYLCKLGTNQNCGAVAYEPQSLEAPSASFINGLLDGKMGSVGISRFSELDAQTRNRWHKHTVSPGSLDLTWVFTANHRSRYFKFYITKQDWDPNAPLTLSEFDTTPLSCANPTPDWQPPQQPPSSGLTFTCQLPKRTGYQVIMAVWKVDDTTNSFYNLIDVQFPDDQPYPVDYYTSSIGAIQASADLNPGDKVLLMTLTKDGSSMLTPLITIDNEAGAQAANWSYNAAKAINDHFNGVLKAGVKDANNVITPNYGNNTIYRHESSSYTTAEIKIKTEDSTDQTLAKISNLHSEYTVDNNKTTITFNIESDHDQPVTTTVSLVGSDGDQVGQYTINTKAYETTHVSLPVENVSAGKYTLTVIHHAQNQPTQQESHIINLISSSTTQKVNVTLYGTVNYYQASDIAAHAQSITARTWYTTYALGNRNLSENPIIVSPWNNGWNTLKAVVCPIPAHNVTSVYYVVSGSNDKVSCQINT